MTDAFRTLIIPSAQAPLAREIAASFGPGGSGMWTTPLSATGADPASHYISSGYIPAEFAFMVPCQTWEWQQPEGEPGAWVLVSSEPGDPQAVFEAVSAAGVSCTLADVKAIFASADVTVQEPFVAMARLGLQIINPPMEQ